MKNEGWKEEPPPRRQPNVESGTNRPVDPISVQMANVTMWFVLTLLGLTIAGLWVKLFIIGYVLSGC